MTVFELGTFASEIKHAFLRCFDVGDTSIPISGGVFHVGAKALLEEGGGKFVVLLVCFVGGDGDGGGFEIGDVFSQEFLTTFTIECFEGLEGVFEA